MCVCKTFKRLVMVVNIKTLFVLVVLLVCVCLATCGSEMCEFSWYAPMPFINGSVVQRMKVKSIEMGSQHLPEIRWVYIYIYIYIYVCFHTLLFIYNNLSLILGW